MTRYRRPTRIIRFGVPLAVLLFLLPTAVALPGPDDVRGPCLTAMEKVEARAAAIVDDPPGPGYIEQAFVALLEDIGKARRACGTIPAWYELLDCVTDIDSVTVFGIECRPIVRSTTKAIYHCVFGVLWGSNNGSPCTSVPHPTCVDEIEPNCDAYRQTTRYVTGGWDGNSYFLACPMPNTWRTVVGAGGGCNFVCPQDTCRIVVDDDLYSNVRFKVCMEPCDLRRAPTYHNQATVDVGKGKLFQVYLPKTGSTTGTVTTTLG